MGLQVLADSMNKINIVTLKMENRTGPYYIGKTLYTLTMRFFCKEMSWLYMAEIDQNECIHINIMHHFASCCV